MWWQLKESQEDRLRHSYGQHPLYKMCCAYYQCATAEMAHFTLTDGQVFCICASMLDHLLEEESPTGMKVKEAFDSLKHELRQKHKKIEMQESETLACMTACICRTVLAHHYLSCYNYHHRNWLNSVTDKDSGIKYLGCSRTYAEEIGQWINQYTKSDAWLTDEIKELLSDKQNEGKKKGGRKAKSIETMRETFVYKPKGMKEAEINARLGLVFHELKSKEYIDMKTSQDTVLKLFKGEPLDTKIIWIGTQTELCYFFRRLVNELNFVKLTSGAGLWQVVASRFINNKGDSLDNNNLRMNKTIPKNTQFLDNIIQLFDPNLLDLNSLSDVYRDHENENGNVPEHEEYYKGAGLTVKYRK